MLSKRKKDNLIQPIKNEQNFEFDKKKKSVLQIERKDV